MKNRFAWPVILAALMVGLLVCALLLNRQAEPAAGKTARSAVPVQSRPPVADRRTTETSNRAMVDDPTRGETTTSSAPTSHYALANTEVEMVEGAETVQLTGSDGLFDRVPVPADRPVTLKLNLPGLQVGRDVVIFAPNGGSIHQADQGPLRFKATASVMQVEVVFQANGSPGAYMVVIQHEGESQTLDFWQGPPHPRGLPGPAYSASNAPNSQNL